MSMRLELIRLLKISGIFRDGEYSRHRAQLNIRVLHSRDVMFQTAICSALEHDPRTSTMTCGLHDGSSSLFSMLPLCTPSEDVNWEKYKKAVIFRHVDANGTLVHLFVSFMKTSRICADNGPSDSGTKRRMRPHADHARHSLPLRRHDQLGQRRRAEYA